MVITTGMMRLSFACAWVPALNCLQNSMMLTPCGPSAGPTGGAGFALPAGSCSFTWPVIFFMGALQGQLRQQTDDASRRAGACPPPFSAQRQPRGALLHTAGDKPPPYG